jgi:hypothetical protein
MKKPLCLIACLLLAGCTDTDWNRALNYGGMADAPEAPDAPPGRTARPAPQPAAAEAAPPGNSDFCKTVAAQDASRSEFDAATKARMFTQSYAQCLNIYTR